MPSFYASTPKILNYLNQVVTSISSFRNKNLVVFDMRGNGGGDSDWGDMILEQLYGECFAKSRISVIENAQYGEWRVSQNNLSYINNTMLPYVSKSSRATNEIAILREVSDKMKQAFTAGIPFVKVYEKIRNLTKCNKNSKSFYHGSIYIVTDGMCGSACLTFIEHARVFPNVYLVGMPTRADTLYVENRSETLPSGNIDLIFPMKAERNLPRKSNEAYYPDYTFSGDINDTTALQNWVLRLYKKINRNQIL